MILDGIITYQHCNNEESKMILTYRSTDDIYNLTRFYPLVMSSIKLIEEYSGVNCSVLEVVLAQVPDIPGLPEESAAVKLTVAYIQKDEGDENYTLRERVAGVYVFPAYPRFETLRYVNHIYDLEEPSE